jgi:hypothetical protein
MPTSPVSTWGASMLVPYANPEDAHLEHINLKPSTVYAKGTLVGEITASPGVYGPYLTGNTDGTQNPTHVLQYACTTDASGNVTFGSGVLVGSPGGEFGQTSKSAPAFRTGYFACADLVGLDAGAVAKLGRLVAGDVNTGRIMIYGV